MATFNVKPCVAGNDMVSTEEKKNTLIIDPIKKKN